jgi:hypothetical protein
MASMARGVSALPPHPKNGHFLDPSCLRELSTRLPQPKYRAGFRADYLPASCQLIFQFQLTGNWRTAADGAPRNQRATENWQRSAQN